MPPISPISSTTIAKIKSEKATSTLINCAYIGMILSVSRYTAHLEEQKEHDAQLQLQIETNAADSEAQAAAEPTAQILRPMIS